MGNPCGRRARPGSVLMVASQVVGGDVIDLDEKLLFRVPPTRLRDDVQAWLPSFILFSEMFTGRKTSISSQERVSHFSSSAWTYHAATQPRGKRALGAHVGSALRGGSSKMRLHGLRRGLARVIYTKSQRPGSCYLENVEGGHGDAARTQQAHPCAGKQTR